MSISVSPVSHSVNAADEAKHLAAGYTHGQRLLEISGITTFMGLAAIVLVQLAWHCVEYRLPWFAIVGVTLAAVVSGELAADFASGLVHWAADNWGSVDWPVLGSGFIRPFRLHHVDAKDITRHSFIELNGNNCIVSLPIFWIAHVAAQGHGLSGLFFGAFWVSLAVWVFGTNQFHAWAHADDPPKWVRALQRRRLILAQQHHDVHHTSPHNRNYCITTGWLNRPLQTVRFFETIEYIMTRVTGIAPNHHHIAKRQLQKESP